MGFAPVQLDENLIASVQVQNDAVAGVVIVLIRILGNSAGSDLEWEKGTGTLEKGGKERRKNADRREGGKVPELIVTSKERNI